MALIHYHGTPITPRGLLEGELAGRHFCVPFSDRRDDATCHRIGQSVMLDNGAFSIWKDKKRPPIDWRAWRNWVEPWMDYQTTWCVLPDSIEGDEAENDRLLEQWPVERGVPVWHLHESLDRLASLVSRHGRVCFGSSGQYATVGSVGWHRRVSSAFDTIADPDGRVPWVHMLRGMSLSGSQYPFASADSTDVAQNHHLPHKSARGIADRWDAVQCPARWTRVDQLEIAV